MENHQLLKGDTSRTAILNKFAIYFSSCSCSVFISSVEESSSVVSIRIYFHFVTLLVIFYLEKYFVKVSFNLKVSVASCIREMN